MILLQLIDKLTNDASQEYLLNGGAIMTVIDELGKGITHPSPFSDSEEMYKEIQSFARAQMVRLDPIRPSGGGLIEVGSNTSIRWHTILPPVTSRGPHLSLRKISWRNLSFSSFGKSSEWGKRLGTIPALFIGGATGSGKTSLLALILEGSHLDERVFIAESLPELPLLSPTWVRLVEQKENLEGLGAFTIKDILRESLRMRPDLFVLGEIRGEESEGLFQMFMASHQGVMSTIHVDHPDLLIPRLANLSGISEVSWSHVFRKVRPYFLILKRKKPRIAGLFRYDENGFKPID